jgi:phenylacetate-coenzyme A ligase PaaK-like adenylate-forming protein
MGYIAGAAHDFAAMQVVQPLYRLYQLAHPGWRAGAREFNRGMRFRRKAARWAADQKRESVLRLLRLSVHRAWRETEYYRELFARIGFDPRADFSFADFARIPPLERADVHAAGLSLRSNAVAADQRRLDATGGSTGSPTVIWTGPEERGWRESGIEHFMRRLGLPVGSRTAMLWGHHLDPIARQSLKDRLHDVASNRRWFDCLRLSPAMLQQYHASMQQWRPHCILAYASSLAQLAEEIARRGDRPSYPTHCCVTGAEKLLPEQRGLIEQVFGRPVHERYGSRDVGLIGFQSGIGDATDFEIDWCNVLVEPATDETNASILVTKLHADAMPMLRYRIGDIGRFPSGSLPGTPTFTLHEVIGREADRIWLPDGTWVHGLSLPHLMKDYPVRDFQLVQNHDLNVVVKVLPTNDFSASSEERILELLRANLSGIRVDLLLVDEIARSQSNKRRPVISDVSSRAQELAT